MRFLASSVASAHEGVSAAVVSPVLQSAEHTLDAVALLVGCLICLLTVHLHVRFLSDVMRVRSDEL